MGAFGTDPNLKCCHYYTQTAILKFSKNLYFKWPLTRGLMAIWIGRKKSSKHTTIWANGHFDGYQTRPKK